MKILNYLLNILVAIWLIGIAACGGGGNNNPPPSDPQAEVKAKLTSGTWNVQSVTRDNMDASSDFTGFTIKFAATTYTVQNGGTALSSSGSWAFDGSSTSRIILEGVLNVALSFSNSDTNLQLRFTIPVTEYSLGRIETLQGNYVFNLVK
jgi:hypothetical protein